MSFKIGEKVKVSRRYPIDSDHPIAHADEADMWNLVGVVVGTDDDYIHVEPFGLFNIWPRKEKYDPLTFWHFYPEELEKA